MRGRRDKCAMALDVLIVDDSAAIRKILHRVLLQADLKLGRVHEANDGQEALEQMRNETVGLVLTDINMPNMDGLEFLKALKANPAWQSIPVMIVTTEGSQEKVIQALKLGAAGYVKKPFIPDQIKDKLGGIVQSKAEGKETSRRPGESRTAWGAISVG